MWLIFFCEESLIEKERVLTKAYRADILSAAKKRNQLFPIMEIEVDALASSYTARAARRWSSG